MFKTILEKLRKPAPEPIPKKLGPTVVKLNQQMVLLRNVTDYLPAEEHRAVYRGLFESIMTIAQTVMPEADTEERASRVLVILKDAVAIGTLRRDYLLPAGRKNTDYRKYKNMYTHALVTAVAVEGAIELSGGLFVPPGVPGLEEWLGGLSEDSKAPRGGPALWVRALLPEPGLESLQEDPMVWADWLDYFEDPENSVMAQIAERGRIWSRTGVHPDKTKPKPVVDTKAIAAKLERDIAAQKGATVSQPGLAGWEVIEAIKTALADGSLTSGQPESIVQVDCDGRTFLRTPEIYEWYQENHDPETTANTIRNRVKKIGVLERKSAKEIYLAIVARGGVPVEGVILKSSTLLWGETPPTGSIMIQGMKGSG